jgi:hypothetical protein
MVGTLFQYEPEIPNPWDPSRRNLMGLSGPKSQSICTKNDDPRPCTDPSGWVIVSRWND